MVYIISNFDVLMLDSPTFQFIQFSKKSVKNPQPIFRKNK